MRPFLLCLLLAPLMGADTPPKPKPAPAAAEPPAVVDPATAKKAEEAADAYLKQVNTRPDPLAETALAEIEVLLLEVHTFLDSNKALKAGERYLAAIEKRKAIAEDQRPLLGKRLQKVDGDLVVLSRELLGQAAFDLGDPPASTPTSPSPPVGQPAK